jgi:hypothetical protein
VGQERERCARWRESVVGSSFGEDTDVVVVVAVVDAVGAVAGLAPVVAAFVGRG